MAVETLPTIVALIVPPTHKSPPIPTPPATVNAPVAVDIAACVELVYIVPAVAKLPVAASIVNGPTMAPLCMKKNLFAIVPISPR